MEEASISTEVSYIKRLVASWHLLMHSFDDSSYCACSLNFHVSPNCTNSSMMYDILIGFMFVSRLFHYVLGLAFMVVV
jgi:hypothetical protein